MIKQNSISNSNTATINKICKALGLVWVGVSVYFLLSATNLVLLERIFLYAGTVMICIASWALMENKRWGRLTILGVAALTNLDLAIAIFQIYAAPVRLQREILNGGSVGSFLLNAYEMGPVYGALLLALDLFTCIWLLLPRVRESYDRGKRVKFAALQSIIAGFLLLVLTLGYAVNGVSHGVMDTIRVKRAAYVNLQTLRAKQLHRVRSIIFSL